MYTHIYIRVLCNTTQAFYSSPHTHTQTHTQKHTQPHTHTLPIYDVHVLYMNPSRTSQQCEFANKTTNAQAANQAYIDMYICNVYSHMKYAYSVSQRYGFANKTSNTQAANRTSQVSLPLTLPHIGSLYI